MEWGFWTAAAAIWGAVLSTAHVLARAFSRRPLLYLEPSPYDNDDEAINLKVVNNDARPLVITRARWLCVRHGAADFTFGEPTHSDAVDVKNSFSREQCFAFMPPHTVLDIPVTMGRNTDVILMLMWKRHWFPVPNVPLLCRLNMEVSRDLNARHVERW